MRKTTLREKLKKDILLLDGAFGTYAQSLGLSDEHFKDIPGCMEYLSIASADLIRRIHSDYLNAGSDAIETNTFGGNRIKLREFDAEKRVYELNYASTRLARETADKYSTDSRPRFVVGAMGPTGKLPSSTDKELGNIEYNELKDIFFEQSLALLDGGADALLIETGQDLLEMKAAVNGANQAVLSKNKDIIIMAQCTLSNNGRMLLGTEISAVNAVLSYLGVDVIGINCSTGPLEMEGAIRYLSDTCPGMVSCVPNAGLPIDKGGKTFYTLPDDEMTDIMERFLASYRIDILGGCCGTTPAYINKMRSVVDKARKKIKADKQCFFSGFYKGVNLAETHPPIIVGERINTHGSRKMKGLLRERDFDGIMETGKAQENTGADILDVCTVLTERKTESEDMVVIFKELAQSVQTPLMVDSTDEDVIKAALENYPGTAFINSVNLEDGGAKADRIFELAKEHGSFIVNLVIDGKGMAKTVERKVEIADKLYSRAVNEFGIEPCRMIFDMLTFTLGTGEKEYADSAVNTLGAIKLIKKKHPEALTILGISNVSFGLSRPARKILNRLFLHHALKNSLDLCIINPADYFDIDSVPEKERLLAENLIFNRNKKALNEFVEYFSVTEREQAGSGAEKSEERSLTIEEKIIKCIFDRDKKNITRFIDEALLLYKAEDIINNLLMGAMKDVGEKLDKGEMVLPFVLQSAEVMRKALEYLEKFLEKGNIVKGKVLLATVFGDVHDIGKNLVKMILQNHGFTVIDLGKQVPVERIVSEAKKNKVDAVGLSALLVSTARHMRTCVQAMHEAGLAYPLLIGGAPISRAFARDISFLNNKSLYKGGVFYAKDAFTGLNIIQALMNSREKEKIMRDYLEQLESGQEQPRPMGNRDFDKNAKIIPGNKKIPVPPFYGIRTLINIPADEVFSFLDEKQLFNLAWGAKLKDKKKKERLIKEEYKPLLEALKQEVIRKGLLELKAVYGYFKCRVDSKGMRVLDKENKPACDILFERDRNNFSLADYFSGEDIVSFQVVTVGDKISTEINKLSGRKEQTKAFFLHGLSVYLAEALAAYIHSVIRRELGLKEGQGKRYSPGYPLWRKISDQEIIFRLLDVNKRLGIKLTGEYQMIPEQSTTAMVVYNEAAEY